MLIAVHVFSTKVVCCLVNVFSLFVPMMWFNLVCLLVPVSGEFSGSWAVQKYSVLQCIYDVFLKMCVSPTVHKGARNALTKQQTTFVENT